MIKAESNVFDFKLSLIIKELTVESSGYFRLCFYSIAAMKVHLYR